MVKGIYGQLMAMDLKEIESLIKEALPDAKIEIKPENLKKVENILKKDSIHFDKLGLVEGNKITLENDLKISIEDIKEGYKKWLKEYMVN